MGLQRYIASNHDSKRYWALSPSATWKISGFLIANKSCNYFLWHQNILTGLSSLKSSMNKRSRWTITYIATLPDHHNVYTVQNIISLHILLASSEFSESKGLLLLQIRRCNLGFLTNSGNPAKRWTKIIVKPGNWLESWNLYVLREASSIQNNSKQKIFIFWYLVRLRWE